MEFKDKLVVTDEQIDSADLQTLLNWLPNHINNEHIHIFKWKDGFGWTIDNKEMYNLCAGHNGLINALRDFLKRCRKDVDEGKLYVWRELHGYGLLDKELYEHWKSLGIKCG